MVPFRIRHATRYILSDLSPCELNILDQEILDTDDKLSFNEEILFFYRDIV